MKIHYLLPIAITLLTIQCAFPQTGWGSTAPQTTPTWPEKLRQAIPFNDQIGWQLQSRRLTEPFELTTRRLLRHTGIARCAPLSIDRYLELDGRLVHAGAFRTTGPTRIPIAFQCRHYVRIQGDGQQAVQCLEFFDREAARLHLVFYQIDPPPVSPDTLSPRVLPVVTPGWLGQLQHLNQQPTSSGSPSYFLPFFRRAYWRPANMGPGHSSGKGSIHLSDTHISVTGSKNQPTRPTWLRIPK